MFLFTALTLPISRSFCVVWLQANADLIRLSTVHCDQQGAAARRKQECEQLGTVRAPRLG
jgi:hypothetical protein